MSNELTLDQQAKLDDDATNRQPIGADEILLVGDIRFGVPVLKRYYDVKQDWDEVRRALEVIPGGTCGQFVAWTRTSLDESLKTLQEVQRLRDLVWQAETDVVWQAEPADTEG